MGKRYFTTSATGVGGRTGTVHSNNSELTFKLSRPVSFKGEGGDGTNPEELFSLGYAACFGSAFQSVARKNKSEAKAEITVEIAMNDDDTNGGYKLSAKISGLIRGAEQAEAERLMQLAHEMCPYSKATRGNIEVELETKTEA
ncbi:organic hydroperoxide resistance protein-like 2 [Listeria floridensis FSL S10-1187]|uniref:Organic hydroperoxide resistance protein-like 2 n=1 Tax=Listeria floridensis FSL S10-1187 TaxID=1265817 RepID=A0ABN0RDH0_9LIST|nr:Ohr family peroxiredoxin [Listeria floridensis]EUJ29181.1 organic hydroperoxide resistance protein-like 2 [Listeria floridensis FSL S10-1187]